MTEAEWQGCTDPIPMLALLQAKASDRKVRLFRVACCRRVAHLLPLGAYRNALDLAERYADHPPHKGRFKAVITNLGKASYGHRMHDAEDAACTAVSHCFHVGVARSAEWAALNAFDAMAPEGRTGIRQSVVRGPWSVVTTPGALYINGKVLATHYGPRATDE
jgi:hypothetical protein